MTAQLLPPERNHSPSLLGDLPDFQKRALEMLLDLAHNYGPVTRIRLGPVTQYVITEAEGAHHVLQKNSRNYTKEQSFMDVARLALISGDDLFTSDGDPWLHRRRLMQPVFHRRVVNNFRDIIVEESARMLDRWPHGQMLDLEAAMMDVTMSIIGRSMLSQNILDDHPQLYHAFSEVSGFVLDKATTLSLRLTPLFVPTPRNRAFKHALSVIRDTLGDVVRQRRQLPAEQHPPDLLSLMMAGHDDESGFTLSTAQLMDELFGIVTAGHETSAVTLSWLFYELARHPEVEAQLVAELDRVLAGRMPTVEDLAALPYLQQCVDETLRRYPAAYVTTRQSIGTDEIAGFPIPAHATMLINIYGIHHHRDDWQHPERFDPDRWSRDEIDRLAFLAFGAGPRKCIGEPLARLEMALITACVLQRFRFRPADRPSRLVTRFTLRAEDGVWLMAARRNGE
ncbi:MAG: cytochrome P450 [Caldilineaceae bacterium]|nr:cytochrome P450 [Caldilineaceae bacterium]